MIGLKINDVIPQTSMIVYLKIIPRVRVGYEMVGSERGEERLVGYNHLISKKREWNNCFIKKPTKYREFFPTLFVKTTDFQLVFNFEHTRTVTIFGYLESKL